MKERALSSLTPRRTRPTLSRTSSQENHFAPQLAWPNLNQSILKEINPEYSLEGLMLKLKLQYFGHLMQTGDSLEKTLRLREDWGQKKGETDDEVAGWHHRFNGRELGQAPGDGEGQGSLACCSPWGGEQSITTWQLNNNPNPNPKVHLRFSVRYYRKAWTKFFGQPNTKLQEAARAQCRELTLWLEAKSLSFPKSWFLVCKMTQLAWLEGSFSFLLPLKTLILSFLRLSQWALYVCVCSIHTCAHLLMGSWKGCILVVPGPAVLSKSTSLAGRKVKMTRLESDYGSWRDSFLREWRPIEQ